MSRGWFCVALKVKLQCKLYNVTLFWRQHKAGVGSYTSYHLNNFYLYIDWVLLSILIVLVLAENMCILSPKIKIIISSITFRLCIISVCIYRLNEFRETSFTHLTSKWCFRESYAGFLNKFPVSTRIRKLIIVGIELLAPELVAVWLRPDKRVISDP